MARNIIAIVVLTTILAGIGYVYMAFMENIRYAMSAKDFEQELNVQLKSLLKEFDDREYYGDLKVTSYDPFTCDDLLFCLSPRILIGSKHIQFAFLNNRISVSDLSNDRLSLRIDTHISATLSNKTLNAQAQKDIELIQSILPNQISCHLVSQAKGAKSLISKQSSCDIFTTAATYKIKMDSQASNPTYANVSIPTLWLGKNRFSNPINLAKTDIALQNFGIEIRSIDLQDRIFQIVQRTKMGALLHRSAYESALYHAIINTLEAFLKKHGMLSSYQETASNLAQATASLLIGQTHTLKIALRAKANQGIPFFSEEEIEDFEYYINEDPKQILEIILQNYDIIIES